MSSLLSSLYIKGEMESIWIILIWVLLYLGLPIPFLSSVSWWDRVIFYWMLLNVLVCIYEIVMLVNRYRLNTYLTNFWSLDVPLVSSLTPEFWLSGWAEYTRFDPRYQDPTNYVHLIELGNVVITLIPSLLIMGAILKGDMTTSLYRLAIVISVYQLVATSVFDIMLIMSGAEDSKYWIYAIFDLPWIIMPIVTIMWAWKNLSSSSK